MSGEDRLMTAAEVAALFRVVPGTVTRWAEAGLLDAIQMQPHGQRRYRESAIRALLDGEPPPTPTAAPTSWASVPADVYARNNMGGRP